MKRFWMVAVFLFLLTHDARLTTVFAAGRSQGPKAVTRPTVRETTAEAAGTATVSGKVAYEGAAPSRERIKMAADPVCQQQHKEPALSEDLVVNNGALQNVFVYVKEGLSGGFPAPKEPVVLNQQGCAYTPHVFGIQAGQPLEIVNSDSTLHNINAQPKTNKRFNIAQPVKGMKSTKTFDQPEIGIPFKCNVHPWMASYGHALNHPFFGVSDSNGGFSLKNLPAGTYTIEAWHEKLGTQTQSVTVADGETKQVSFSFKGK